MIHRPLPSVGFAILSFFVAACTSPEDGPAGDGDSGEVDGSGAAWGDVFGTGGVGDVSNPSAGGTTGTGGVIPPDEVDPETLEEVTVVVEENTEAFCALDGVVESDHTGFLGDGYSNTDNGLANGLEWAVYSQVSQTVVVTVRYAAESGNRSGSLSLVSGGAASSVTLAATGAWTTWSEDSAMVQLVPGNHILRIEATTADGLPNIDHVSVTGLGLTAGSCSTIPVGGECTPGARHCLDAETPQLCDASGNWQSESDCPEGCSLGQCNSGSDDPGVIRLTDSVPGWASVPALGLANGTTGGGQNPAAAVTVTSMAQLQSAAGGSNSGVVLVEPGTYSGTLSIGSNKTIIGKGPGVVVQGNVNLSGSSNVILRNMTIRGNSCSTYDECRAGSDAVSVQNSAHHIWLDHLDVADGQDGNLDITKEADYVTVSFAKFHYTYNKEHRFSNLISSSDDSFDDRNKLQVTYMNCWWGERVNQRMPRGRFGKVHILNNFFNSQDSGQIIHGPGVEVSYIIEGNFYEVASGTQSIKADYGTVTSVVAKNNTGNASGMNQTLGGPEFDIPYAFSALASSQVKALVTAPEGGAGNTCTFSG